MVGLTLDEKGIPKKAEERFEIAKRIVNRAVSCGIKPKDIFIDCLSLTVSAQQEEAIETIKAITMVKTLGVKTILGVSNISFGLPNRKALNASFLTLALGAGLDLAIINPNEYSMMEAINSFKILNNTDKGCINYINQYSNINNSKIGFIYKDWQRFAIGYFSWKRIKRWSKNVTLNLLKEKDENYILDEILIPALDKVGKRYDSGDIFLPQLIQSAETVKVSLNTIKETLLSKSSNNVSKGKIIVATVKGDIHDIGKNIVKIMLENYGYEVIDLGKDVPIEEVVEVAKKRNIKLVGLSALMTTTVQSMKDTIQALRDNEINAKVFVGGAVLTEEYAEEMGADYYSKDAKSAVEIAKLNF